MPFGDNGVRYPVEQALDLPIIATGTPESIERDIKAEREMQEKLTNQSH
jgi:hypothetical protein